MRRRCRSGRLSGGGEELPWVDDNVVRLPVGHKLDGRSDHSGVAVGPVELVEMRSKPFLMLEILLSVSFITDNTLV